MAMTPELYSINALAVELGRDRRTIAQKLQHVPPDGKRGKHSAWYLMTAMSALQPERRARSTGTNEESPFFRLWLDRLETWEEIRCRPKSPTVEKIMNASPSDFAELAGIPADVAPEIALRWLRMGMPFTKEGDWRTGEGFTLHFMWAMEWHCLVYAHLVNRRADNSVWAATGFNYVRAAHH